MAYSSVSSKPNPKPKAHPSTSADAQSFELTKAFLDEHIFTLAALEEKAAPLVARITEELRSELEKNVPRQIEARLQTAMDNSVVIKELSTELNDSVRRLREKQEVLNPTLNTLHDLIVQSSYLQNAGNYVRLVVYIGTLTNKMEHTLHVLNQQTPFSSLIQKSISQIRDQKSRAQPSVSSRHGGKHQDIFKSDCDQYFELTKTNILAPFITLLEVSLSLQKLKCHHLKTMLDEQIRSLKARIEIVLKSWFSSCLDILSWPTIMSETAQGTFNETSLGFFRSAFVNLAKFQKADISYSMQFDPTYPQHPVLWVIDMLLKPLQSRFTFNFRGRESTNRFDRPEWIFSYIHKLMEGHSKFFELVTSLLHSLGYFAYDARHEMLRGLNKMIKEKLISDLNLIISLGPSAPSSNTILGFPNPPLSQIQRKLGSLVLGGSGILSSTTSLMTESKPQTSSSATLGSSSSTLGGIDKSNTSLDSSGLSTKRKPTSLTQDVVCALVSHTINEILDFEKLLNDVYEYPLSSPDQVSTQSQSSPAPASDGDWDNLNLSSALEPMAIDFPRPIEVLTIPDFFKWWLQLELDSMRQHFRESFQSADAWKRQYASVPVSEDPTRVPKHCFVLFNVLAIVQERYTLLGGGRKDLMSEFLEGQMTLLGDYLSDLKEYQADLRSFNDTKDYIKHACSLLNAVWYSRKVLEDWSNNLVYIELYMFNQRITDVEKLSGSVFDPIIQQCKALSKYLVRLMVDKTSSTLTTAFNNTYLKYNFMEEFATFKVPAEVWAEDDDQNDDTSCAALNRKISMANLDVSAPLCDIVFLLKESLNVVESHLNVSMQHKYWKGLAATLNMLWLEKVIFKKRFNALGALQIATDFQTFLLIWRTLTPHPESYFKESSEAVRLLNLSPRKYRQLTEFVASYGRNQQSDMKSKGVFNLSYSQLSNLVERRAILKE